MQAKFLSALILVSASLVSAGTQEVPGEVYFCGKNNWVAPCKDLIFELGRCQKAATFLDGGAQIASIGPNNHTVCIGYKSANCSGSASWGFTFPGDADGGVASGTNFTALQSLVCYDKSL
ncbi:hypothetical protein BDN72DRAFT_616692 [Pluteus cervinus]|uniref:Uncharacterized protein n=2 Tax=Pluteus cervinus TaxID=181527 RepID=A0ACD3ATR9_9AGAR|nr:hypothetical protein BDN72DRAFT_959640 [Pluteus cervinus]TFK69369.1 hypothetical protein BDN72DRAFT_616692 [Pluteus cervinus]